MPLRGTGEPILNLTNPGNVTAARQRQTIDAIRDLNLQHAMATGDAEIETRIAAYEMASRMQTSAPDLIDLSKESASTLAMYGIERDTPSFARNCLLARRLVERASGSSSCITPTGTATVARAKTSMPTSRDSAARSTRARPPW